ncbi:MAG: IS30 family transposase [Pseudonocardia sp.]|nr:IS30 family transposase [Pseudonocardia sp.]
MQDRLDRRWSPARISRALRGGYPDQPARQLSTTEAIYQAIDRTGSEIRRPQHDAAAFRPPIPPPTCGARACPRQLVSMVFIDERPDIADRSVAGHWEGDLIVGAGNRSAIETLVERTSRYTILLHLAGDRSADAVKAAVIAAFADLPVHLRRSLT